MPLGPYIPGCAVVLVGEAHQESDSYKRNPIGTGFFVRVASETVPDAQYRYLITCQHVIEDQNHMQMQIPTAEDPTKLCKFDHYPLTDVPDLQHPVKRLDLAIAEFSPPMNVLPRLDPRALLANTFHYVGYLQPPELAIARSGTLGLLDEMLADPDYEYPTHIGVVRSYSGLSGSPYFIECPVPLTTKEQTFPRADDEPVVRIAYLHLLCGMFTGHLDKSVHGGPVSRRGVGVHPGKRGDLECPDVRPSARATTRKDKRGASGSLAAPTSVGDRGREPGL